MEDYKNNEVFDGRGEKKEASLICLSISRENVLWLVTFQRKEEEGKDEIISFNGINHNIE